MIMKRVALVGLVLIPLVSGCAAETPEAPATTTSTTLAAPKAPTPLPGSTPPGTRLRFGDKAVITVGRADNPSRVGVIVTGVDKAPPADMAVLRQYPQVNRWAYFIRVILVNEDGHGSYSGYSGPTLYGDLGDGGDAGQFQLLGADLHLPHCTVHSSPPGEWSAAGARFETCRIIFANPSSVRLDPGHEDGGIHWEE
ncbi:MAG: hypothetical protein GEU98_10690 [Pseudonocardiaceae bacterium]|nr:hypothetical protein [Pseudonocardiaceae bacterium]